MPIAGWYSQKKKNSLISIFSRLYMLSLLGWIAGYLIIGDHSSFFALINPFAVWLFAPLPVTLAVFAFQRKGDFFVLGAAASIVFVCLWGNILLPRWKKPQVGNNTIKILTYNLNYINREFTEVAGVIIRESPDVLIFQEINYTMLEYLGLNFSDVYPYHTHAIENGVFGQAVFSKYPITTREDQLPFDWTGPPQILDLNWNGRVVTLVNMHMLAPWMGTLDSIDAGFRMREKQAQALVDLTRSIGNPVIIAGDANTAPLSKAYKILDVGLQDAWVEAGFGPGFNFSGKEQVAFLKQFFPWLPVPNWHIRIDYVFVSEDWGVLEAYLPVADNFSDHRPLVAVIGFAE